MKFRIRRWYALLLGVWGLSAGAAELLPTLPVSLDQCLELAVRRNFGLLAERLNPAIARDYLGVAQGVYDPVFTTDTRWESASDSGGFDPVDFSRDAIYSAESTSVRSSVTGYAPTGLTYTLNGGYAHSDGERNFLNFDSYGVFAGVAVQQPLLKNLWIDLPRLTLRLNQKSIEISEEGVRFYLMDLLNQVHWAFYNLHFATRSHELLQQIQDARRQLIRGLERQVEQGYLSAADTLPARVQLASGDAALLAARNAMELASHALQLLIQEDVQTHPNLLLPLEPPPLPNDEMLNLQSSWSRGLLRRPDLAQLRLDVERGELQVRFRRNQLFPSLNVVAGYARRGASTAQLPPPLDPQASAGEAWGQLRDGDVPSDFLGFVFSIPLTRKTERSAFHASRKLKEQAELRVRQLEGQVLREISDAVSTVELTRQRAEAAATAVTLAAQALRAEERKLAAGRSSLFFVLQLQDEYLNAQTTELRARTDHWQAWSQLQYAEGTLLDALPLDLRVTATAAP